MLDHLLLTRNLLAYYCGSVIYREVLCDESIAFGTDRKVPGFDQTPIVAAFQLA